MANPHSREQARRPRLSVPTPRGVALDFGPVCRPARCAYGVLVDHGEAPYRHDPEQSASYFVTVRDAKCQERTAWGVGLKDAIETSKTAPVAGDVVGIRRAGSEPVTVMQRLVDENGEVTTHAIGAKRQTWEVEKGGLL